MKKVTVVTVCLAFDTIARGEGFNRKSNVVFQNRKTAELYANDAEAVYENALADARAWFCDDKIVNAYVDEIVINTVELF